MSTNPFTHTRAALEVFDAGEPARRSVWERGDFESNADVDKAEAADRAALARVQHAFWKDTKKINSRENCNLVSIQFMRQCVERSKP